MKLDWRGKEYDLKIRALTAKKDNNRKADIDSNIYGADTESVILSDRYEPQCFQISSTDNDFLVYVPERAYSLEHFINFWIDKFYWKEEENRYSFMFFHNLIYDWSQLVKYYPELVAITRTGQGISDPLPLWKYSGLQISLAKGGLFEGTAPHFSITFEQGKKIHEMKFRDTWSFFPSSLKKITNDLKLTPKEERPPELGKIDYRKISDEDEEKKRFEIYGKIDAKATREVAEKIRTIHKAADMKRIRVSSPGFAISKLFHTIPAGTVLTSGAENRETMQIILDSYGGGRTGGIYHGKVNNLSVFDFHSSYPASMCMLPSFTDKMGYIHISGEKLTVKEIIELLNKYPVFAVVSGEEKNSKYPSLITSVKNRLTPVYGKFSKIASTGAEIYAGIKSGDLVISTWHDLIILDDSESELLPFKIFIESAYDRKEKSEKESAEYQSAKVEMNSSYGKLIESRSENFIAFEHRDLIVPYLPEQEKEFAEMYYNLYIECLSKKTDFLNELDEVINAITNDTDEDFLNSFCYGELEQLSLTKKEYGYNAIPAAAALITGISRARLITAIKATNALYWDTDSIFIEGMTFSEICAAISKTEKILPAYVWPVKIGDRLGDLGLELERAEGWLAGTKRYYLSGINETGNPSIKKALHGIPAIPYAKAESIIESLATGNNFSYVGRERPKQIKESKTVEEIGRFVNENYTSNFSLDPRLSWEQTKTGWNGACRPITEIALDKCQKMAIIK